MASRIVCLTDAPRQLRSQYQLAILHGEAGNLDAALHHLSRAIEGNNQGHDPCIVHLVVTPQWDSLRADPQFHLWPARMSLPHEFVVRMGG